MAGTGRVYVNGSPRAVGNNQYDVDIRFDIAFDWGGYNNNGNAYYEIAIHGHSTQSGNATFNVPSGGGGWVWANIGGTKTFRVTMPTSGAAHTISFGAWIDTRINPKYIEATATYTLPARTWQWRVSYNANGGTGAPGAQTKTKGSNLILSGTRPSRTGYIFKGWATSANGGVAYQPGGTYSTDANVTLYAVWQIITYTVSYNANGGTGAPGAQTKNYGATLKLSSTKPTRTNYNFLGWGTSSGSTSVAYAAGANYTANASITLYAIWQLAYTKPRITNLSASRCNSGGAYAEEGQYAKVTFNWATDRAVSGIKIVCNGTTTNASGSGTSGSVSVVVGANKLSTENSYTVTVSVSDSGGTTSQSTTVAPLAYIMDVKAGGKGVAFGMPAKSDNFFDVNMPYTRLHGSLQLASNAKYIYSAFTDGTPRLMFGVNQNNDLVIGYGGTVTNGGVANFSTVIYGNDQIVFYINNVNRAFINNSGLTVSNLTVNAASTFTGQLRRNHAGGAWIAGRDNAMIRNDSDPGTGRFAAIATMRAGSGYWTIGTLGTNLYFSWTTNSNYNANNNTGTNPYIDTSGQYRQPNGITYVNGTGGSYSGTYDFADLRTAGNYIIHTPANGSRTTQLQWGGQKSNGVYYIQIKTAQNPTYWGIDTWASDISLKNSIVESTVKALEKVNEIKVYQFYYNDFEEPIKVGFLAQQLEMVDEQLVFSVEDNEDDAILQPNKSAIIPLVTKAVQELDDKVDELENKVATLEERIASLEKIIEELRGEKHE